MKVDYIYCDSCVFLSYFQSPTERSQTIRQLFEDVQNNPNCRLLTSVISITEVSHVAEERNGKKLRAEFEQTLDFLWSDESLLDIVEYHEQIAREASVGPQI
jgi:predicted nucleic acid-binding protein